MKNFRQDPYLFLPILFLSICLAVILMSTLLLFPVLPNKLPLFYSLAWGETQLVQKLQFFILPLSLLLISLINLVLIWQLHSSQVILKRLLSLSTIAISSIVLITAIKIITIFV